MDAIPTTRQQWRSTLGQMRLVVFAVTVTLGMAIVLSLNIGAVTQVNVEVGQPAPADVFAPRSHTFTSDILTERARDQARNEVQDIYTELDLTVGRAQLALATSIFAFVDTVRADTVATPEEKIALLQAVEDVAISEEVANDLISMSQSDYDEARAEILRIIDDLMREGIRESQLEEYQRIARTTQASLNLTSAQSNVVTNLAWQFLVPVIFLDEEATNLAREQAAAEVEPVTRTVAQNQRILRGGEIVSETDIEALTQLGLLRQDTNWYLIGSVFLVSLLAVLLIVLYWRQFHSQLHDNSRYLILLGGLILLFTGGAKAVTVAGEYWPYLFPLTALSLLLAVVFDTRFSLFVTIVMAGVFGYISANSLELMLYTGVAGAFAVLALRDAQRVIAFFQAGLIATIGGILVLTIFSLPQQMELFDWLMRGLYSLGNGMFSAALTLAGFYVIGSLFGITTTLQLQDLSRLDHPLLQELLRRAPGTYHHSIMVANLAEQAAERVRANSTLVRVGAFYHDIGKMNRPPFFTENQEGVNPHDQLDPYTSARIIINHVPDGLELARQYRLPNRIRDFIAEHHGTRIVKGFYHKARTQAGDAAGDVDKEQFRYPGPRPRSRETGIVMLADAIEATSSALRPDNAAAIEKLVNSIVDEDVMEGQLNNSGLSLGDIEKMRASFIETLKGRFHLRVKYPGNEELEVPGLPAALPAPAERPLVPEPEPVRDAIIQRTEDPAR